MHGLIYLKHGGWRYWTMGRPIAEEPIINREDVHRKGVRWVDEEIDRGVQGTSSEDQLLCEG